MLIPFEGCTRELWGYQNHNTCSLFRRERQRVGGLLKKRNEPTQTLVNDDMEEPIEVAAAAAEVR